MLRSLFAFDASSRASAVFAFNVIFPKHLAILAKRMVGMIPVGTGGAFVFDECRCVHGGFTDYSAGLFCCDVNRYPLGRETIYSYGLSAANVIANGRFVHA